MIKRALISVSDKTAVTSLGLALQDMDVEILSTGGTARTLREAGIRVTDVADVTGFPEIMDGRVKTLHPHIHGGILARRGTDDAVLRIHQIAPIDLVVVNLYPFSETIAKPGCEFSRAIEQIDIGGPAMLRAAAKNHAWVTVVVDSEDYTKVIGQMQSHGRVDDSTRQRLAAKAFAHTAQYDAAIAGYMTAQSQPQENVFPDTLQLHFHHRQALRYGENPQQRAAFYVESAKLGMAATQQLQGKELSFNNIVDADTAMACVAGFDGTACVIVKHANPCGVAQAGSMLEAYDKAYSTDPTSAFGGIIAFNKELDKQTADAIIGRQFVEVIIAPSISTDAAAALSEKKNVRVLSTSHWPHPYRAWDYKRVTGGLLVQDTDAHELGRHDCKVVSRRQPSEQEWNDLLFAWRVVTFVKSNGIVYCRDGCTIGIGAGQMSRVYSSRIAAIKAADEKLAMDNTVMASDAFFPFRDGIDEAAKAGAKAVIQPGGSMRDEEVIAAADEHGMAMVLTGVRHFRH